MHKLLLLTLILTSSISAVNTNPTYSKAFAFTYFKTQVANIITLYTSPQREQELDLLLRDLKSTYPLEQSLIHAATKYINTKKSLN